MATPNLFGVQRKVVARTDSGLIPARGHGREAVRRDVQAMRQRIRQRGWLLSVALLIALGCGGEGRSAGRPALPAAGSGVANLPATTPLWVVVMDPLSDQLACECLRGSAQRKYDRLAAFLEGHLARPVRVAYGESLAHVLPHLGGPPDLIIGKYSAVLWNAGQTNTPVRNVAVLTDTTGTTDLYGLFVVRRDDPAKGLADLKGRSIRLGPVWAAEKHAAAIAALEAHGVSVPQPIPTKPKPGPLRAGEVSTSPGCNIAALAVVEGEADAAVISSYAAPLLEGRGMIERGALRVIGKTAPVPFITAFATDHVSQEEEAAMVRALLRVGEDPSLCAQMDSQRGFIRPPAEWSGWRGAAVGQEPAVCRLQRLTADR